MMNIFEEAYRGIQEAKNAYAAATNTAEQDAARAIYKQATSKLDGLSSTEQRIWSAYETAMDCGNEYLDLNDTIRDGAVEGLVACMKEYGIEAFPRVQGGFLPMIAAHDFHGQLFFRQLGMKRAIVDAAAHVCDLFQTFV